MEINRPGKCIINGIEYRRCRECRDTKILNNEFFIKKDSKNAYRGICRICYNKKQREKKEISGSEKIKYQKYKDERKVNPLNYLLRGAKSRSKIKNREFDLTLSFLKDLWEDQKGLCFYTGEPINFTLGFKDSISLDRKDSLRGYTMDNTVLCRR